MNNLLLFSDSQACTRHFSAIASSRKWKLDILSVQMLKSSLKNGPGSDLILIDHASLDDEEKKKTVKAVKRSGYAAGIIDRKSEIDDPALLLMCGIDYIGAKLLKQGIKVDRLDRAMEFFIERSPQKAETVPTEKLKTVDSWKKIKAGGDYAFSMLFTEISFPVELKKKSGQKHLEGLKKTFEEVVRRESQRNDGRIWIWNEYGGLILFPFDGSSTAAVLTGVRLLLNRLLISIEDFGMHSSVSIRAAVHVGNLTYNGRGKTGTIISDSINSIFHLGTSFTNADNLCITEETMRFLPERLAELFHPAGEYEDREIFRLRQFEISI